MVVGISWRSLKFVISRCVILSGELRCGLDLICLDADRATDLRPFQIRMLENSLIVLLPGIAPGDDKKVRAQWKESERW